MVLKRRDRRMTLWAFAEPLPRPLSAPFAVGVKNRGPCGPGSRRTRPGTLSAACPGRPTTAASWPKASSNTRRSPSADA